MNMFFILLLLLFGLFNIRKYWKIKKKSTNNFIKKGILTIKEFIVLCIFYGFLRNIYLNCNPHITVMYSRYFEFKSCNYLLIV